MRFRDELALVTDSRSRSSLSMYLYCMRSCSFFKLIGRLKVYLKIMFIFAAVRCVMERCRVGVQYSRAQRIELENAVWCNIAQAWYTYSSVTCNF